jgi:hypothetical protein
MSFSTSLFSDTRIRVISHLDPALSDDFNFDLYDNYLRDLDESILSFKHGEYPTRFVLKRYLSDAERAGVVDNQITMGEDKNIRVKVSASDEEVRRALVDIETDPSVTDGLAWVKDKGDKWCCRELISKLAQAGILDDLRKARQYSTEKRGGVEAVKKS